MKRTQKLVTWGIVILVVLVVLLMLIAAFLFVEGVAIYQMVKLEKKL